MEETIIKRKSHFTIMKLFTSFVVLIPILQYYKSPFSIFNMATFLSFVFVFIFLFDSRGLLKFDRRVIPVFIYITFISLNIIVSSYLVKYSISESIMEYFRMLMLLISVLFLGFNYFELSYALKILEKILFVSALFMIIQLIMIYVFNHPITGNIPVLVTNEGYKIARNRPSGFYMEPAAYAQSSLLYLCFILFNRNLNIKKRLPYLCVIVLGIFMSGSGQGYALLSLLFFVWILYNFFFVNMSKKMIVRGIVIILLVSIAVVIVLKTSYGQYALSRIINDEGSSLIDHLGGSALSGRTYTNSLFYTLPNIQKIFGVGFGRSDTIAGNYYLNSLFYYLIECGYLSFLLWIYLLFLIFIRGNTSIRIFVIIFALLFTFSGCGRPMMICFYFSFLLKGKVKDINNYQKNVCECLNE